MGPVALFLLVALAHAESGGGVWLADGPVREWVQAVAIEGETPPTPELGTAGSAPAEAVVAGLAAPRVGIAWPLAPGHDRVAAVLTELIAGPSGVLERRLVFTQEVAVRVEGGEVSGLGGGGALVVLVQLRPGVHPGVAQAAIEATVDVLLALDDAQLQAEIDRATAALERAQRLSGQAPPQAQPPVDVAQLRSLAATLGMPAAWRVAQFMPAVQP